MLVKHGVVQFSSGEYAAVIFGEGESEEEICAIPDISWGDKGIVGDYCSPCESRVLFIYPCDDQESAKEMAEGVAAQIMNIVDLKIEEDAVWNDGPVCEEDFLKQIAVSLILGVREIHLHPDSLFFA